MAQQDQVHPQPATAPGGESEQIQNPKPSQAEGERDPDERPAHGYAGENPPKPSQAEGE